MMRATRTASGLPGMGVTGWAKASAGRTPSAAIFGSGPSGVISRNFGSTLGPGRAAGTPLPGAGITTSWRAAGRAVDDIDCGRAGRDRFLALGCARWALARTIVPAGPAGRERLDDSHGLLLRASARSSPALRVANWIGTTATGSPPNGLSLMTAQTTKMREEKREHPGDDLGDGEADGGAALPAMLAQRGAQIVRRHRPSSRTAHARITEQSLSRRPNSKPVRTISYVPRAPRWILAAKKIRGGHWPPQ